MWRGTASKLKFELADGLDVICHGHLDVYAPRGSYQLVVDELQPKGIGALELALRKLREKLAAEGLVRSGAEAQAAGVSAADGVRHQPHRRGGARFSRSAAAPLARRRRADHPGPRARRRRGGGNRRRHSTGQPAVAAAGCARGRPRRRQPRRPVGFNEEPVVRAIAASRIPTVSAVGHEIDVTLADLAADVRALTPSEAAERVVPAAEEIVGAHARHITQRLRHAAHRRVMLLRARLDGVASQRPFRRPFELIHDRSRRLDELSTARQFVDAPTAARPRRADLATLAGKLESLSPLAVLGRGYTITQDAKTGAVVRSAEQASRRAVDRHALRRRRSDQQRRSIEVGSA